MNMLDVLDGGRVIRSFDRLLGVSVAISIWRAHHSENHDRAQLPGSRFRLTWVPDKSPSNAWPSPPYETRPYETAGQSSFMLLATTESPIRAATSPSAVVGLKLASLHGRIGAEARTGARKQSFRHPPPKRFS